MSAAGGRLSQRDGNHIVHRMPSQVPVSEHGIKISDLRSSLHPIDQMAGQDVEQHLTTSSFPVTGILESQDHQAGTAPEESARASVQDTPSRADGVGSKPETLTDSQNATQTDTEAPATTFHNSYSHQLDRIGDLSLQADEPSIDDVAYFDATTSVVESDGPRIQAFAKLEFDDGQFYMNTYAVELGRDIRAARSALQQDFQNDPAQEQLSAAHSRHRSSSSLDGSHAPHILRRSRQRNTASSVMSESGGIWNFVPYSADGARRSKSRKTKSEGGSSSRIPRDQTTSQKSGFMLRTAQSENTVRHSTYGAQPVNPSALMPSPEECPLIPIHPPAAADGANAGHRGISRKHVRISFNFERRLFEMEVKGRNGAFVDEQFHALGELAELRSGSYIQIGGVGIRFLLPNVARGETGAEGTQGSEGQSAMSFDFEDGRGDSIAMAGTSESESSDIDGRAPSPRRSPLHSAVAGNMSDADGENTSQSEEAGSVGGARRVPSGRASRGTKTASGKKLPPHVKVKVKTKAESKVATKNRAGEEITEETIKALDLGIPLSMIPPRRRGPGRPPKNGIISKREEANLKKQAREAAKAQAAADGSVDFDVLKQSLDLSTLEKRKYTKRKKHEGEPNGVEVHESIEGSDQPIVSQTEAFTVPKPAKEKKPKPPKSPSPFIDESTLTPEQLAKPQQSYVVLIHEALTNCSTGQMSLPQIYKAIERRYPYFKFKVQTVGWQSSIRHNLSQHPAFCKVEREGKGWMWGLVPEVSIEKEKRLRRPSPPPISQTSYYPPNSQMFRPPYPYSGVPAPQVNGPHAAGGQHFLYPSPAASGINIPNVSSGPHGLPIPIPQHNGESTYQSPYTSAPKSISTEEVGGSSAILTLKDEASSTPSNQAHAARPKPETNHKMQFPNAQSHLQPQNNTLASQPFGSSPSTAADQGPSMSSETLSENVLGAVNRFKSIMISSMSGIPNAEEVVTQAVNKTLGIHSSDSEHKEFPGEQAIISALRSLLDQIRESERQEAKRQEEEQARKKKREKDQTETIEVSHTRANSSGSNADKSLVEESPHLTLENAQPSNVISSAASETGEPSSQLRAAHGEQMGTPRVPPLSPITELQSAPNSAPQTELSNEDSTKPSLAYNSKAKGLDEAEKEHLFSLLQQLGSPSSSAATVSAQPRDASSSGAASGHLNDSLANGAERGVKRKHDEHLSSKGGSESGASPQDYGMVGIEGSQAKRVAV